MNTLYGHNDFAATPWPRWVFRHRCMSSLQMIASGCSKSSRLSWAIPFWDDKPPLWNMQVDLRRITGLAENPKITRQMPASYSNTTVSLHGHEAKIRPVVDKVPHEWTPNHKTIKSLHCSRFRCFSIRLPWLPGIWIDQNWAKNIRNKANCSLSQTSHRQKCWLQPHTLQAGPVGENGVRFWEVLVNETDNAYQKVWRKNLLNQCSLGNAGVVKSPSICIDSDFEIYEYSWRYMSLQALRTRTRAPEYGTTCTYLHHVEFRWIWCSTPVPIEYGACKNTVPSNILCFYHFGLSAPGISLSSRYCSKRISVSLVFALSVSVAG